MKWVFPSRQQFSGQKNSKTGHRRSALPAITTLALFLSLFTALPVARAATPSNVEFASLSACPDEYIGQFSVKIKIQKCLFTGMKVDFQNTVIATHGGSTLKILFGETVVVESKESTLTQTFIEAGQYKFQVIDGSLPIKNQIIANEYFFVIDQPAQSSRLSRMAAIDSPLSAFKQSYVLTFNDLSIVGYLQDNFGYLPTQLAPGSESTPIDTNIIFYKKKLKSGVLGQITISLTSDQFAVIKNDRRVISINKNIIESIDSVGWNLDRIDQPSLPGNGSLNQPASIYNPTVYVLDTGVNYNHNEFGGFASDGGRITGCWHFTYLTSDCMDYDGHGTHVSGTALGTTYGVAKTAKLYFFKITDDYSGSTSWSYISSAMSHIADDHASADPSHLAVMNLSFGSSSSCDYYHNYYCYGSTYLSAFENLRSNNIIPVVAAGNSGQDACYYSYGFTGSDPYNYAVSVGATYYSGNTDTRATFSNYGQCVSIYAPGQYIVSAAYDDDAGSAMMSGTSMASPLVAGALAKFISTYPQVGMDEAIDWLLGSAQHGIISGTNITHNLLLSMIPGSYAPAISFSADRDSAKASETVTLTMDPGAGSGTPAFTVSGSSCAVSGSILKVTANVLTTCTVNASIPANGYFAKRTAAPISVIFHPVLVPTVDSPIPTTTGFKFNITNYDSKFQFSGTSTNGSAVVTLGSPVAKNIPVTVSGLTAGQTATVTIQTTRSEYETGTVEVNGRALQRQSSLTNLSGTGAITAGSNTGPINAGGGSGTGAFSVANNSETICDVTGIGGQVMAIRGGTCSYTFTRAGDANFLSETLTVTRSIIGSTQPSTFISKYKVNGVDQLDSNTVIHRPYGTTSVTVEALPTNSLTKAVVRGASGLVAGSNTVALDITYKSQTLITDSVTVIVDPGLPLLPTFSTPVKTADGFTVNLTNYDSGFTFTPSATAGTIHAGAVSGKNLPLSVTGLNPGDSSTIGVAVTRIGYTSANASISSNALLAGLVPTFDSPVPTSAGFTVNLTNYDPAYTFTPTLTPGSATKGNPSGSTLPLTITGLSPLAVSSLTMTVTRNGYANGVASVSSRALGVAQTLTLSAAAPTSDGFTFTVTNYDTNFAIVATTNNGSVSLGSASGKIRPVTVSGLNPGDSATVTLVTSRSGYVSGTISQKGSANKASQTISFSPSLTTTMFPTVETLTLTASSSLTPLLASTSPGVCTVSGKAVTHITAGKCTLTASQPGNATYLAATPVTVNITVSKVNQTIFFAQPSTMTFGDADQSLVDTTTAAALSVVVTVGDATICSIVAGKLHALKSGNCVLTANQVGDYRFNVATSVSRTVAISKASQTITFNQPSAMTFGQADQAISASTTATGLTVVLATNDVALCKISNGKLQVLKSGSCLVTASQSGDARYDSATSVTRTVLISAGTQSLTFNQPSAMVVGSDQALSATSVITGLAGSTGLTATFSVADTSICSIISGKLHAVGVGTCVVTAAQAGDARYSAASSVARNVTITGKAQTISTTTPSSLKIGQSPYTIIATSVIPGSTTSTGLTSFTVSTSTEAVCIVSGMVLTLKAAGTCSITISQSGNSIYAPATLTKSITIKLT